MAHAASLQLNLRGVSLTLIYVRWGWVSKTHLMQAIGHYRLEICPDSKIFMFQPSSSLTI